MAHYAHVVNGVVQNVIVAEENDKKFIRNYENRIQGELIKTSYNTKGGVHYDPETGEPDDKEPLRKNFAAKGYKYDKEKDAFIPPKPYESWQLNEETCLWEAPIEKPSDEKEYVWEENSKSWVLSDKYD